MPGFEESQWRKLDNAAIAFPAATGKKDTRVFRFSCELKEPVNEELLQKALDKTVEKYPLFQAVLRKGLFWFYLERRNIRAEVTREKKPPCSKLYIPDQKSLLFEVTWHENRINFEVFHALTDGTGAMHFLLELVRNYLTLAHPEQNFPEPESGADTTSKDQEEDSFSQYYSSKQSKDREKGRIAVQLKGEHLAADEMRITEVVVPVKEILAKSRELNVSVTVLTASMLLWAIHEEIPTTRLHKPVTLMIPVNLRNYFPSRSMTNFWGWIEVGYVFKEDTVFTDVLYHVKEKFNRNLEKEQVAARMNAMVRLEKNPILRAVPLEIKQFFLMAGTTLGARNVTAVYSNMGVIKLPGEYEDYIDSFHLFASTDNLQLCSCAYKDDLMLGFTSKLPSENIQRNFMRLLRDQNLSCRELEKNFPGYKTERSETGKTLFQVFTFLSIAAMVICAAIDLMLNGSPGWSIYSAAGIFSGWLLTAVAYRKRRNPLKNEMWLLVFLSLISTLWDYFTGWKGWSIDFVLPLTALAVLVSMPIIIHAQHLEKQEYLFYLAQARVFGLIPLLLMLVDVTKLPYPSILCASVSFLVLIGLFIFCSRDIFREIHKKFRL
ncbi:MAG: DUF6320 domain-containing protein [Lachnospiraceae bacterium]|nr:DUF6320 domain-containing protein [Lachnospiraceae bacterium]